MSVSFSNIEPDDAVRSFNELDVNMRDFKLFSNLKQEELDYLNGSKNFECFKKGEVVYSEGSRQNGAFFIISGIVKIYKTGANGREHIIRFAKNGELFGYRSVLSQEVACSSTRVLHEAVLCHIPYKALLFLIEKNWEFSNQIMQMMCDELRDSNDVITNMTQKSTLMRVAEELLALKDRFELDHHDNLQILLKRTELADVVGAAPETVIRFLSELKQDKLIQMDGKKIKIINPQGLHQIANRKMFCARG